MRKTLSRNSFNSSTPPTAKLARSTGRTKTFYVREAILEHLDDLEELYLAERVLQRIRSVEEQTIPLEDALKRHGLED